MKKIETLYNEYWAAGKERRHQIISDLCDISAEDSYSVYKYLLKESRRNPERKFEIIGIMEELSLEEAADFIEKTLKTEEDKFMRLLINPEKAIKLGWINRQDNKVLEKCFEIDSETEKYSYKSYSIILNLNKTNKIISIVRHTDSGMVLDDDMLKLVKSLAQATGRDEGSDDLPYFPLYMHYQYMKVMEELTNSH